MHIYNANVGNLESPSCCFSPELLLLQWFTPPSAATCLFLSWGFFLSLIFQLNSGLDGDLPMAHLWFVHVFPSVQHSTCHMVNSQKIAEESCKPEGGKHGALGVSKALC